MNSVVSDWASLGITFNCDFTRDSSPEEAIIKTIQSGEFPKDKKLFSLMLLWINKNHQYIHAERLKNMARDLTASELALLGGLCLKIINLGDHRFKSIVKIVDKKLGTSRIEFSDLSDHAFLIKRDGQDDEFAQYGIKVAKLKASNEKKILSEEKIIKMNRWIKNRCLFGVNFRADMATVIEQGLASSAYQASKFLNCSMNSSYSNWNDLKKVGWPW